MKTQVKTAFSYKAFLQKRRLSLVLFPYILYKWHSKVIQWQKSKTSLAFVAQKDHRCALL